MPVKLKSGHQHPLQFCYSIQKIFFRQLDLPKTLGITLTDGLLMVPEKSVTAFIGLFPEGGGKPGSTDGIAKTGKDLT